MGNSGVSSLSWWFAAHPAWKPGEDWPQEVPVVCLETDDEIVLMDPFLPQDSSFDPRGKAVRVLLTQGAQPAGVEALELDGEPQQVVFFIREHATLVTGDVLTGRDGVMRRSWTRPTASRCSPRSSGSRSCRSSG